MGNDELRDLRLVYMDTPRMKPYKCENCGRKFSLGGNYKSHMKNVPRGCKKPKFGLNI